MVDHEELLRLNNQGNVILSAIIFPTIAALFAFSDEVIQFLFTKEYVSGSPVLRIYLVQTLIYSVEITTLLYVFEQGSSSMRYEASILPFAVLSSLVGVWYYGLPGAAIGSVLATFRGVCACSEKTFKGDERSYRKIAGLEEPWKNLDRIGSLRTRGTFFGRPAEAIDSNCCDSRACRSFGAVCYYFVCDGVLSNACRDAKRMGIYSPCLRQHPLGSISIRQADLSPANSTKNG